MLEVGTAKYGIYTQSCLDCGLKLWISMAIMWTIVVSSLTISAPVLFVSKLVF